MESINKFFIIAASLIVTAGLIFVGFRMADIGTEAANHAIEKLVVFERELQKAELLQYDGAEVSGSDVVNFLRKHLDERSSVEQKGMKIIVIQGEKCKEYEKADEIKEICNFSHESYINPSALFVGNVSENANGIISEVSFVLK